MGGYGIGGVPAAIRWGGAIRRPKKTVETIMRVGYPAYLLTGTAVSHVVSGSGHAAVTTLLAVLAVIPWALRPPSRALEILFSVRAFSS